MYTGINIKKNFSNKIYTTIYVHSCVFLELVPDM